ncbi:unnamed protein product [Candida verbasci]|uniref:Protein SQS1 n=1 Tax=Candida verbasci TaxID=1227364 RepID=A0A9W4TT60_9ASCO|nr:unnamed protein product [Candida verbasci]
MPKRGNRRKTSSRGGNKSNGRIFSNGKKNNNRIRGNKRRSPNDSTSYNELMDLNDNIYLPPLNENSLASVARNIGRRKYGHGSLIEEIVYTNSQNHDDLMSRKLRNRPVQFVLAKEIYDPNVILHKLTNKDDERDKVNVNDIIDEEFKSISLDDSENEIDEEKINESHLFNEGEEEEEEEIEDEEEEEEEEDDQYDHNHGMYGSDDDDNVQQGETLYEYEGISEEEDIDNELELRLSKLEKQMNRVSEKNDLEAKSLKDSQLDIIIDAPTQKVEAKKESPDMSSDDSPEYGYLEEDYEFDVSKIEVSNVRFGINNQYYIKSIELVGIPDSFVWIDEDDVIEFALNNGVKQHRLSRFLSFITKGLIDKQVEEENEESEVYISDDSEVDDYPYESEDNLNDLIEYSKINKINFTDRDDLFSNNLPFEDRISYEELDDELEESLQRQLKQYQHDRKRKNNVKEQQKIEEAVARNDMLIKYPISLHIRDIKKEFDLLLKDEVRQSMSFPTLDTHAHKTIKKMADCYHMSVHKCGAQGVRKYLKIVKTKATFKYLPNYPNVDKILRGRPIFHRIDKKPDPKNGKTKDYITKSNKAKFKEGDIVGAEAPELDSNNLGRQMLEKLGWTKGQGLGTDNRGINEPILAKVKTSKLGIR